MRSASLSELITGQDIRTYVVRFPSRAVKESCGQQVFGSILIFSLGPGLELYAFKDISTVLGPRNNLAYVPKCLSAACEHPENDHAPFYRKCNF